MRTTVKPGAKPLQEDVDRLADTLAKVSEQIEGLTVAVAALHERMEHVEASTRAPQD